MFQKVVVIGFVSVLMAVSAAAADFDGPIVDTQTRSFEEPDRLESNADTERPSTDWRTRGHLFGTMGGFRTWLGEHGMSLDIESVSDGFVRPGADPEAGDGGRYTGLINVVYAVDTDAARWWPGGLFVINLQNTHGGDISDLAGDLQGISNIVAPPGTRFAEYFFTQQFGDGRYLLKIGKQDANADFVVAEGGAEFVNSSFGIIPTVPLPTFPAPGLGIMAAWSPSRVFRLKAGFWEGDPDLGSGFSAGLFSGDASVGAVGLELRPFGGEILDGVYRVGVWRHSEVEIASAPKSASEPRVGPASGVYFTADQGLWQGRKRGLFLFLQGGWAESDRLPISRYLGGGLTWTNPFRADGGDLLGVGLARAGLGDSEQGGSISPVETVVEMFYQFPILGWMTIKPDLQWVHQPGGSDETVFVAGLRMATVF